MPVEKEEVPDGTTLFVTYSQLMALQTLLTDYITMKDHIEAFVDVARGVTTPVEDLIKIVTPNFPKPPSV